MTMGKYSFTTNNVPRHKTYGCELPPSARGEFDYLSDDEFTDREFVQYRGTWFDLGDVSLTPSDLASHGYDGYVQTSLWDGYAFRYFDVDGNALDGGDSIVVAHYTNG